MRFLTKTYPDLAPHHTPHYPLEKKIKPLLDIINLSYAMTSSGKAAQLKSEIERTSDLDSSDSVL